MEEILPPFLSCIPLVAPAFHYILLPFHKLFYFGWFDCATLCKFTNTFETALIETVSLTTFIVVTVSTIFSFFAFLMSLKC